MLTKDAGLLNRHTACSTILTVYALNLVMCIWRNGVYMTWWCDVYIMIWQGDVYITLCAMCIQYDVMMCIWHDRMIRQDVWCVYNIREWCVYDDTVWCIYFMTCYDYKPLYFRNKYIINLCTFWCLIFSWNYVLHQTFFSIPCLI